jgi:DTW domain-containing protein
VTRFGRCNPSRCRRCLLHECCCAALVQVPVRTRVVVIMPTTEVRKPTNTGRLVPLLLTGGEVRLRGVEGAPLQVEDLLVPERRTFVLDPDARATLDAELVASDPRPATLIVLDGTWRQARRILNRTLALNRAQRVRLAEGAPSRYRLRTPKATDKLATLEAIARALLPLEGPEVTAHLEAAFDEVVESTLRSRGA